MDTNKLDLLFSTFKETKLCNRYITNKHIIPILKKLGMNFKVNVLGYSENKLPIYGVNFGNGTNKILMWSQMHGNESTTTKALFDFFNYLKSMPVEVFSNFSICVIPILNPDGAEVYTRLNYRGVDLNRDAQLRSQSESRILRDLFDSFQPDYCFNLHDQRTIFSSGNIKKPATLSFLSPAQNITRDLSKNRLEAMAIIGYVSRELLQNCKADIGIGRYDDSFNLQCVGDTFQSLGVPTLLFEAGHYSGDYTRDITRKYIFKSLLLSLAYILNPNNKQAMVKLYHRIPENKKLFFDLILKNSNPSNPKISIAVQFKEILLDEQVIFVPTVEKVGDLSNYYGHFEFDLKNPKYSHLTDLELTVGTEIDFELLNIN